MNNYEQRMYCVVMRHLSGIAKGIQATHAIVEYANHFANKRNYKHWSRKDKTLILLEANTSEQLQDVIYKLGHNQVNVMDFREPDLENNRTAIAFILDEPVWNYEKYPIATSHRVEQLRELISPFKLASN